MSSYIIQILPLVSSRQKGNKQQLAWHTERKECPVSLCRCVLYEMLAGTPPYVAMNQLALSEKICHGPAPDLPTTCPPQLAYIITGALQKLPQRRPSMEQCFNLISCLCDATEGIARPLDPSVVGRPNHNRRAPPLLHILAPLTSVVASLSLKIYPKTISIDAGNPQSCGYHRTCGAPAHRALELTASNEIALSSCVAVLSLVFLCASFRADQSGHEYGGTKQRGQVYVCRSAAASLI